MTEIHAVIFDLDNILIDCQRAFCEMLSQVLPKFLPQKTSKFLNQIINEVLHWDVRGQVPYKETFLRLFAEYKITNMTLQQSNEDRLKKAALLLICLMM